MPPASRRRLMLAQFGEQSPQRSSACFSARQGSAGWSLWCLEAAGSIGQRISIRPDEHSAANVPLIVSR